jgi:hypothetical protein
LAGLGGEGEKDYCLQEVDVDGQPGCLAFPGRDLELSQANGFFAVAIYYRFGGRSSTSDVEAISQSGHGSSKPALREVMCSPWKASRPWLGLVVGRGLLSCWPSFLGGDASRMPANGGRGAQGLDCLLSFSSRVLVIKRSALSLDRRFPRTTMQRLHLYPVTATF